MGRPENWWNPGTIGFNIADQTLLRMTLSGILRSWSKTLQKFRKRNETSQKLGLIRRILSNEGGEGI